MHATLFFILFTLLSGMILIFDQNVCIFSSVAHNYDPGLIIPLLLCCAILYSYTGKVSQVVNRQKRDDLHLKELVIPTSLRKPLMPTETGSYCKQKETWDQPAATSQSRLTRFTVRLCHRSPPLEVMICWPSVLCLSKKYNIFTRVRVS